MNDRQKRISLLARKNFGAGRKTGFHSSSFSRSESSLLEDCLTDIETVDRLRQLSSSNYESAKRDTEPAFVRYFSKAEHKEVLISYPASAPKSATRQSFYYLGRVNYVEQFQSAVLLR